MSKPGAGHNIAKELRAIVTETRPLVEQWLDLAEQFGGLREAATQRGLDWGQIKALVKAQVQDERDGADGKRVNRIIEKADYASSYADMLGLGSAKLNENYFSSDGDDQSSVPHRKAAPDQPAEERAGRDLPLKHGLEGEDEKEAGAASVVVPASTLPPERIVTADVRREPVPEIDITIPEILRRTA